MTYNSTTNLDKLNIYNYVKYTDDSTYDYHMRNILYMPYGTLSDNFVNNFNSMIVRNNNKYYEIILNRFDAKINNYRNELNDYINLYRQYQQERYKIMNNDKLKAYDKKVYDFIMPHIITLNKNIYDNLSIQYNDINQDIDRTKYIIYLMIFMLCCVFYVIIKNNIYKNI